MKKYVKASDESYRKNKFNSILRRVCDVFEHTAQRNLGVKIEARPTEDVDEYDDHVVLYVDIYHDDVKLFQQPVVVNKEVTYRVSATYTDDLYNNLVEELETDGLL